MLTRKRLRLPQTSNPDVAALGKAIADYLLSLEPKQSLTIEADTGVFTAFNAGSGAMVNGTVGSVHTDQNASTLFTVENDTSGTAATANIRASYNASAQFVQLVQRSPGFTNAGMKQQNAGELSCSGNTNGLKITTLDSAAIFFGTNNLERGNIDANGNFVWGTGSLGTTATNGFVYIPSCAGAPTGVPTAMAGRVPLIYDTTNNKLWAYNGAWKGVALV